MHTNDLESFRRLLRQNLKLAVRLHHAPAERFVSLYVELAKQQGFEINEESVIAARIAERDFERHLPSTTTASKATIPEIAGGLTGDVDGPLPMLIRRGRTRVDF